MNIKKDYDRLFQHWLSEFDQTELTQFLQEDFNSYKNCMNTIKATEIEDKDKIKIELLKTYKDHFEYLFEDLLKIRKIKVMNAALALQEINLKDILEPEKLLYQNLVSTIKGYDKIKALSLLEDFESEEIPVEAAPSISEKEKIVENVEEIHKIEEIDDVKELEGDIEEPVEFKQDTDYNYTILRFIKNTPPLVGIDLKNYGPFDENDIASMPYKNALILINEKFAEKVELS
jgi:DNA replication factor GINS